MRERQEAEEQLNGMGTTCVAAILDANVLTVANVGDSRGYLLRNGRLTQITQDHSSVWEQVLAGNMSPDEALGNISGLTDCLTCAPCASWMGL